MTEYHKIQTVYQRNPATKYKTLIEGEYAKPEFEYLKNNLWIFTEKVDGTNIRVIYQDEKITFAGKTERANIPAPLVNALAAMFLPMISTFEEEFSKGCVLYGEGYGAGIQKGGGNYRQDQGFVLFDVRIGKWWLKRDDVQAVADVLGISTVPVFGAGTLLDMVAIVKGGGLVSRYGDFQAEGIVARPKVELLDRGGNRIITKIKCKDFGP